MNTKPKVVHSVPSVADIAKVGSILNHLAMIEARQNTIMISQAFILEQLNPGSTKEGWIKKLGEIYDDQLSKTLPHVAESLERLAANLAVANKGKPEGK